MCKALLKAEGTEPAPRGAYTPGGEAEKTGLAGGTCAASAQEKRSVSDRGVVLDRAPTGITEKVTNKHLES